MGSRFGPFVLLPRGLRCLSGWSGRRYGITEVMKSSGFKTMRLQLLRFDRRYIVSEMIPARRKVWDLANLADLIALRRFWVILGGGVGIEDGTRDGLIELRELWIAFQDTAFSRRQHPQIDLSGKHRNTKDAAQSLRVIK